VAKVMVGVLVQMPIQMVVAAAAMAVLEEAVQVLADLFMDQGRSLLIWVQVVVWVVIIVGSRVEQAVVR